jgi:CDP-diacylglycerol--glycerol-3-phosphate 3-phosphatidyltransferase/cardiolipin synthase
MRLLSNIPLLLTLIRLVVSPLLFPFLIVYCTPSPLLSCRMLPLILVVFLALTDFFDGYLARRWRQETDLGRMLDPIADKFLLYAALVALLAIDAIYFFWVILFIGREFFMVCLREVALHYGIHVKVSSLGKLKTCLQMLFIIVALVRLACPHADTSNSFLSLLESLLLVAALCASIYSAWRYYREFLQKYITMY